MGLGCTHSPPAMLHRLKNPNRLMGSGKCSHTKLLGALDNFYKIMTMTIYWYSQRPHEDVFISINKRPGNILTLCPSRPSTRYPAKKVYLF